MMRSHQIAVLSAALELTPGCGGDAASSSFTSGLHPITSTTGGSGSGASTSSSGQLRCLLRLHRLHEARLCGVRRPRGLPLQGAVRAVRRDERRGELPDSVCKHEPLWGPNPLRLFAEAAAHGRFESICLESYIPALKKTAATIIEQCSLLIPG